jgi:uncharacterized protein YwqG
MRPKYTLSFREVSQPITQPVTKFGGQPTWLTGPQWPLSRSTGTPMRFIGQVVLDHHLFGDMAGRIAYLFITDGEIFVDSKFDPEGGENALIVQPGIYEGPIQALMNGPSLYKMISDLNGERLIPVSCEFAVEYVAGEDPDVIVEDEQAHASEQAWSAFTSFWDECKVGGTPAFLHGSELPQGGPWRLLLQLDSASVPFFVNFGDAGVGYAFVIEDGQMGKFLWQCF